MNATNRLHFRNLAQEDAPRILEIYSNKEAMKFRASKPISSLSEASEMIQNSIAQTMDYQSIRLGIIESQSNHLIGTILIKYLKNSTQCEIGYSIDKAFWNRGYGGESLNAIVQKIRSTHYHLITAWVHQENIGSIKILEKQGFKTIHQQEFPNLFCYRLKLTAPNP
ncbi:GNAT family N-acetyltransferase [Aureispira anguillae]|uniref:GNAT family N-acetyltransferase n=1 Tax=Aureispira anguillae TaxID=2864201 RepID=A0A915YDU6_9BACT|nr:GNAT family N-acetyltransferase [Aureispira anguillae]BDS11285.1 GNAT family N-acetyltransferase [Aureispira anguillae]